MQRRMERQAYRPTFVQVADHLKARIESGELPAGELLPSEPALGQQYEIGRNTVRRAVDVLLREHYIESEPGIGFRVRDRQAVTKVELAPGDEFLIRPATPDEQIRLRLPLGAPVIEIIDGGQRRVLPAYEVRGRVK